MAQSSNFHESLGHDQALKPGSNRSFGFVFTIFFALVGLYPLRRGHDVRAWALALAVVFLLATLIVPRILAPLNLLWFRIGLLLAKIVNPIVITLLFFVAFVPMSVLLRLMGKDPLRLKPEPDSASYWIPRTPSGPEPESMKMQF